MPHHHQWWSAGGITGQAQARQVCQVEKGQQTKILTLNSFSLHQIQLFLPWKIHPFQICALSFPASHFEHTGNFISQKDTKDKTISGLWKANIVQGHNQSWKTEIHHMSQWGEREAMLISQTSAIGNHEINAQAGIPSWTCQPVAKLVCQKSLICQLGEKTGVVHLGYFSHTWAACKKWATQCVKCSCPYACMHPAAATGTLYRVQPTLAQQEGQYREINLT